MSRSNLDSPRDAATAIRDNLSPPQPVRTRSQSKPTFLSPCVAFLADSFSRFLSSTTIAHTGDADLVFRAGRISARGCLVVLDINLLDVVMPLFPEGDEQSSKKHTTTRRLSMNAR
jgi:hypothetical protein